MKTSNKILLIFFISATLIITAVHVAVYAKYTRGEYVSFEKVREGRFDEYKLPGVKYVSITGLQRCNIIPATESKIKIFKMEGSRLQYKVVNDTLVISGDSLMSKQDLEQGKRNFQDVNVYLPAAKEIRAFYTQLFLNGDADTTSTQPYVVTLSEKSFLSTGEFKNKAAFFNRLQINANASTVTFYQGTVINDLTIQATSSEIINQKANIKHLQMSVDSTSTIMLQGKNVTDINFSKE